MPNIQYEATGPDVVMEVDRVVARIHNLEPMFAEATAIVYSHTEQWFDSEGAGTWPKLSPMTVREKASQGAMEPDRPLFFWGNLRESAISPHGPYSHVYPGPDGVAIGIEMSKRGANVAEILSGGAPGYGALHRGIPARPIFPPVDHPIGLAIQHEIAQLLLRWIGGAGGVLPAWPGASVGRAPAGSPGGTGGQFVSLG